jgi:hypothetical protein
LRPTSPGDGVVRIAQGAVDEILVVDVARGEQKERNDPGPDFCALEDLNLR